MEQQLLNILANDNSSRQYRYLLIDGLTTVSEIDFIALDNIQALLGEQAIATVIRPDISHDLNSCPKLITIAKPNQELDKRLLHFSVVQAQNERLSTKSYVCGWMVSQYPPEIITEQMVNIGKQLSKYCAMGFVPFYEPFRMQLLQEGNAICPEFIADMLNMFLNYCYPTIQNTLRNIKQLNYKPKNIDLFMVEEAKFYQQEAKQLFFLYLAQYEIYQEIKKDTNQISLLELAEYYRDAWQYGLQAVNDRFIFALMSYRYGNHLLSNIELKSAVEAAVLEPGSLSDRFKAIDKGVFLSLVKKEIE
ncbi:hypothetical protein JMI89_10055 [Frischella sp. Ac48]|uniref:DUF4123 domain-containing protein n=1 Tax=Frischella japonica TaxID=2741544 RepID=A0ABR7QZP4_9GAMM|nr:MULTISPECIES: hypothetical protein [Frischella]MBC9131521.1 hypothetical protein [Frischella japonica]MBX4133967.1 hypothetical protein [Frischella sp. Ac48]